MREWRVRRRVGMIWTSQSHWGDGRSRTACTWPSVYRTLCTVGPTLPFCTESTANWFSRCTRLQRAPQTPPEPAAVPRAHPHAPPGAAAGTFSGSGRPGRPEPSGTTARGPVAACRHGGGSAHMTAISTCFLDLDGSQRPRWEVVHLHACCTQSARGSGGSVHTAAISVASLGLDGSARTHMWNVARRSLPRPPHPTPTSWGRGGRQLGRRRAEATARGPTPCSDVTTCEQAVLPQ